jgi:methylated-DNA-[protein]-cysteine S-methyltransferase
LAAEPVSAAIVTAAPYAAIVAAPGFCLGIRCDEDEVTAIDFLEPRREIAAKTPLAAETVRQLRAYLADPAFAFSLPLRPAGTTFQRRVWAAISAIPSDQTRTYGQLASTLHNAPRAVGQACGANPYPVVVPCHRVVASGGGLGGFARERGGFLLTVKRWLLGHEGSLPG